MTRTETIELLKVEAEKGHEEALLLMDKVKILVPNLIKYPESARREEVERYNSLVNNCIIYDDRLRKKLVFTK